MMKQQSYWLLFGCLMVPGVDATAAPEAVVHSQILGRSDRAMFSSELMLPLSGDGTQLYYGLLSGVIDDDDSAQLGLGLGMRRRISNGVLGGWVNWDYQNGPAGSELQQLALGSEWLGQRWQAYGTVYLPVGDRNQQLDTHTREISGARSAVVDGQLKLARDRWSQHSSRYREALKGADLELGYLVPLSQPDWQWQLTAGGLYRDGDHVGGFAGGWVGSNLSVTELSWLPSGSRLSFDVQGRYDERDKDDWRGAITLSVPFGGGSNGANTSVNGLFSPVHRERGLVSAEYQRTQSPVLLDSRYEAVVMESGARSLDGLSVARADQQGSLQTAVDSGADVVLVTGEHHLDQSLRIAQVGQLVLGGDTRLKGVESGLVVAAGESAYITGSVAGAPVIEVTADNTLLSDLAVSNSSMALMSTGVMINGANDVGLQRLSISTRSNTGFGVVQNGGSGVGRDLVVSTTGRVAHGVFSMAEGAFQARGRYRFTGEGVHAEEGGVSLTGSIDADYIDDEGEHIFTRLEQNIDEHESAQVMRIAAGAEVDGQVLEQDALLIGGGAITAETLLAFTQARNSGTQPDTLIITGIEGSADDQLNVELGREVHSTAMNTHLVSGGLVASGGVDLFLAGVERSAGDGSNARFGVHSWGSFDSDEPTGAELPRNDPAHQGMLGYFNDINIDTDFYWYTLEAAPFDQIHWMTGQEIERWGMLTR